MNKRSKIYIAGHTGMVGSAVWKKLESKGYGNLIGRTSSQLDLRDGPAVLDFFKIEKPQIVVDSAARVGGILANKNYPYQFLMDNLQIQNSLFDAALKTDVEKFVFLGSSCIYPKLAQQPLKEEYLLTGSLESTNQWYAIAKIAGVKICEAIREQFSKDFISLMPTNLYGPNDNFDLNTSHVLPAMIRKFHEAKEDNHKPVILWGSGRPMREFLFVDDLAEAVYFTLVNNFSESIFNVGTGEDMTVQALANLIQKTIGHKGEILWDTSKPDGTPRKVLNVHKLRNQGWNPSTSMEEGIFLTYEWFRKNLETYKKISI